MSIQRHSSYYDNIYLESEKYSGPIEESEYYQLWMQVLRLIPPAIPIIEIGCGVGQFASLLKQNGFEDYIGYDFSEEAIVKCVALEIDKYSFSKQDVLKLDGVHSAFNLDLAAFFIALEVFEHTDDYRIIRNIGYGKEIIFTVPDFNDTAHVRYFHSVNEVVERYKHVIKFEYIQKFQHWFICKGVTI